MTAAHSGNAVSTLPDSRGFGVEAFRVDRPEDLRATLEKAFALPGPLVVDCRVEKEENVFPMIPSGGTVNDTIDY